MAFLRIVGIALITTLFCFIHPLHAEEAADASAPKVSYAAASSPVHEGGPHGAFTTAVPINRPQFRGLVPQIALTYNSQDRGRGGEDDLVGIGWSLSGLSSILRTAVSGGTPSYDLAHDVFALDGTALVACAGATSTAPWTGSYPAGYLTTVATASCGAGGNFSTLTESTIKILRTGSDGATSSRFEVWRPDGTRMTYTNAGTLAGVATTVTGDTLALAFRRQWLLTEIRDTQATPNIVTIDYAFSAAADGYAARPASMTYAGYRVNFHYEAQPKPLRYATGTTVLGSQTQRLKTIEVKNGTVPIRAYRLSYAISAQTGSSLLTEVREYGNDYTLTGSAITGGSSLPPYTFQYTGDSTYFGRTSYPGTFHTSMVVADSDNNRRDDLLFYNYTQSQNGTARFTLAEDGYRFQADKTLAARFNPQLPPTSLNYASSTAAQTPVGLTRRDLSTSQLYAVMRETTATESETVHVLKSYRVGDSAHTVISTLAQPAGCVETTEPVQSLVGNFDSDPESEVIFGNRVYQVTDGALAEDTARRGALATMLCNGNVFPDNGLVAADIDGDGVDELVGAASYLDIRGTAFVNVAMASSPFSANRPNWVVRFGDVNGDGMEDAVINDRAGADKFGVMLSQGDNFAAVDWTWGSPMGAIDNKEVNYGSARNIVADINGDGLADFITHNGHSTASVQPNSTIPLSTLSARIFLSDGTRFFPNDGAYQYVPDFLGVGDFDGDGLLDTISADSYGNGASIHYNGADVPNLLTSVVDPMGGGTTVRYMASSEVADDQIPGIRQLVKSVTKSNGFDGYNRVTEFAYQRGRFDWTFRRSLGYGVVTASLPAISAETVKPTLVTTYRQDHIGTVGSVLQQDLLYQTTLFSRSAKTWAVSTASVRPLSARLTAEAKTVRMGASLVTSRTSITRDLYGNPLQIVDFGFDGTTPNADNLVTGFSYKYNTSAYVVNRPEWKAIGTGTAVAYADRSNWKQAEFYSYDGSPDFWAVPTRGNLTKVEQWSGVDSLSRRVSAEMTYDAWGNVTTTKDGRGATSTFVYDTAKRLFSTRATNALLHANDTVWSAECQTPTSTVDANALTTRFFQDAFCRPIRTALLHKSADGIHLVNPA